MRCIFSNRFHKSRNQRHPPATLRSSLGNSNAKHCYQQPAAASTPFFTASSDGSDLLGGPRQQSVADSHHPYADALAIVMLRNPYDWALAMHINCW